MATAATPIRIAPPTVRSHKPSAVIAADLCALFLAVAADFRAWVPINPRITPLSPAMGRQRMDRAARSERRSGLEIRRNRLNPVNRRIKRSTDILLSALVLATAAPLLALCARWIRRINPGNPLFRQEREGKDHLQSEVLEEWNRCCKRRSGLRILPGIGAFLRKIHLGELPQLWKLLRGEMNLVGPRPFPAYQKRRVGYFARNWPLWLDLYILVGTLRALVSQRGSF